MLGINLKQYRQFLTKNERNKVYLRKNTAEGRAIADSKYRTKRRLAKAGVQVPKLIARFKIPKNGKILIGLKLRKMW